MIRWLVFKKDNEKKSHEAVGSVHAGSADHALMMARNVFVRRPAAVSLWVVPEQKVVERGKGKGEREEGEFAIFRKVGFRRSMTYVKYLGNVEAASVDHAFELAKAEWDDPDDAVWWAIPVSAIVSSDSGIEASWFEPAKTKTYRQQGRYGFVGKKSRSMKAEG